MALVEAAKFFTGFEAAGIMSVLFDTNMNWGGFDLGVVPVRLMVDEDDLAEARAVLSEPDTDEAPSDHSPPPGPWR